MKPRINTQQQGIQAAATLQNPLRQLRRASLFCILFRLSVSLAAQPASAAAAGPSAVAEQQPVTVAISTVQVNACPLPVYFNYRRRQLQYNGRRIDGITFLNMCRSIPDSSIQEQVERYDGYTAQKQKLGFGAMGSGFAGMAFLGGALGNGNANPEANAILVLTGVVGVLAVPALAIYTSVPHQKRKAVLFRDLPIVYNAYVEAQGSAASCH
jgi:hypothetical protein